MLLTRVPALLAAVSLPAAILLAVVTTSAQITSAERTRHEDRIPGVQGILQAEDFDSLVEEYREVKTEAQGKRGTTLQAATRRAAPLLRKIAQLRSDEALGFLVQEVACPPVLFGREAARALLVSGDPRALKMLLEGFSTQRPGVRRSILDAIDWAAKRGRGAKGKKPKNRPPPLDLTTAAPELIEAAREIKRPELMLRMIPLLGRLRSVEAAAAIVLLGAGEATEKARDDELRHAAVLALASLGGDEAVERWLAEKAFRVAESNPGKLVVVAEVAGRLRIDDAQRRLERLLLHPSAVVAVTAFEALSHLTKGIPTKAVKLAYAWLQRDTSTALRAKILDALVRGERDKDLSLVLRVAKKGDGATRAIAVGSLALARRSSKALEQVLAALKDPVRDVRSTALLVLRGVREKEVISHLIDHLGREKEQRLKVDALNLLVGLTGHNMGLVVADWKKWWNEAKKEFEFPDETEKGPTRVEAYDLSYFGIGISSKRIAFLLDISLSMLPLARSKKTGPQKMRKIDLLKRELTTVLERLSADTCINIHVFDNTVRSWEKQLQPMARGGRERATDYVKKLKTGPGTNIFDSIEIAIGDRNVDTIYLLTDGQPTTGRYASPAGIIKGVRDLNRPRGVVIHCIAFGAESKLLQELAAQHGGEYRFVNE